MTQAQMTRPTGNGATKTPVEYPRAAKEGEGWLLFAGTMFLLVATFNVIWGIAALANDSHFAVDELFVFDLTAWGVIYLGVAAVQAITGLLILNRSGFGAVMGIVCASLGAIAALFAIGVYPLWSVTILVMYGLIIYGLTVYGFGET